MKSALESTTISIIKYPNTNTTAFVIKLPNQTVLYQGNLTKQSQINRIERKDPKIDIRIKYIIQVDGKNEMKIDSWRLMFK